MTPPRDCCDSGFQARTTLGKKDSQHCGGDHTPKNRGAQGPAAGGAGTDGPYQRQNPQNECKRGHEDGTKAKARSFDGRDLDWFLGVCRVVKGLRRLRIGAIGARPALRVQPAHFL